MTFQHFLHVQSELPTAPLLEAVSARPQLWDENRLRHMPGSPHVEADSIWLRFNEDLSSVARVFHQRECQCYPAWDALPEAHNLVTDLAELAKADRVGRVMLTRLRPRGQITPHVDEGRYAAYYERFHIVLQAGAGSVFHSGGEEVEMKPGELWWFNNKVEHWVRNDGRTDRIHLIIDLHRMP